MDDIPNLPGRLAARWRRTPLRPWVVLGVSAILLGLAARAMDLGAALAALGRIGALHWGAALVFLGLNIVLSVVRFRAILAAAGHALAPGRAFAVGVHSLVAGLLPFQIAGQIASRAWMLAPHGVNAARVAALTVYEKATSLLVCLLLLGAGLLVLAGRPGLVLPALLAGFAPHMPTPDAAIPLLGLLCLGGVAVAGGFVLLRRASVRGVLVSLGVTLGAQLAVMVAYAVLAAGLVPGMSFAALLAASALVMYAAALPVSAGGWGVREVASVAVLGALGIGAAEALLASVLTGLLSLVVLGAAAVAAALLGREAAAGA